MTSYIIPSFIKLVYFEIYVDVNSQDGSIYLISDDFMIELDDFFHELNSSGTKILNVQYPFKKYQNWDFIGEQELLNNFKTFKKSGFQNSPAILLILFFSKGENEENEGREMIRIEQNEILSNLYSIIELLRKKIVKSLKKYLNL